MPLSWGFMRNASLPRKVVDGFSVVGQVYSYSDQLKLNKSYGDADLNNGIGLSVGPKEFNA